MANRSEVRKAAWRARKRGPGKGTCYFCKKKIFTGGVVIKGHKFHKGCGESWGAGLKPAQVGKNPVKGDRMQITAKRKRAEAAAKKLQMTKFPNRPQYEIAEDIMNGLLTFSGKPTALGKKVGAYKNPRAQVGKNPGKTYHLKKWAESMIKSMAYPFTSSEGIRHIAQAEAHRQSAETSGATEPEFQRIIDRIKAQYRKNPGTNWHVDRMNELDKLKSKLRIGSPEYYTVTDRYLENEYAAEESRKRGMNPRKSFTDAWIYVRGLINTQGRLWPRHMGMLDVTEVIKFGEIADAHNLTDKGYNDLIDKAQKYYDTHILGLKNPRRKISKRKRAPRDAFRYFGARELNPRAKKAKGDWMKKLKQIEDAWLKTWMQTWRELYPELYERYQRYKWTDTGRIRSLLRKHPTEHEHIATAVRAGTSRRLNPKFHTIVDKSGTTYGAIPFGDKGIQVGRLDSKPLSYITQFYPGMKTAKIENPKFKFGPTGFRPPAKWFAKMAQGTSASYFGRKLKALTSSQRAKIGQIVGGIWAKYTDATRFEILRKYEPSAVRALANPSMLGKRVQMLNCPACGGPNPVSRLNVYLRCSTCGAPLRSVRVRHKR